MQILYIIIIYMKQSARTRTRDHNLIMVTTLEWQLWNYITHWDVREMSRPFTMSLINHNGCQLALTAMLKIPICLLGALCLMTYDTPVANLFLTLRHWMAAIFCLFLLFCCQQYDWWLCVLFFRFFQQKYIYRNIYLYCNLDKSKLMPSKSFEEILWISA